MPIATCSMCGDRPRGRLASIYWSCWTGDGDRAAWKQRFDKACYQDVCAEWLDAARASWNASGGRSCILCEVSDVEELSEIYGTIFVPGEEASRFTVTACLKHLPEAKRQASIGSVALVDRSSYGFDGSRATGW